MDVFDLREPVSAATHAAGFVLAFPATAWLWRRAAGHRWRRVGLLVYGVGLGGCLLCSALFHAARGPDGPVAALAAADRIGIYALIAATVTPIAATVLAGRWRV